MNRKWERGSTGCHAHACRGHADRSDTTCPRQAWAWHPAALTLVVANLFATAARADSTWPTIHRDYQRSGYVDKTIEEPIQRKWFRSFHEEMIGPRVEAIVAEGLCFVGTYAGNFYALKIEDGTNAWKHNSGGRIGHSACYHDGRIHFCTDDAYNAGRLICLSAADGQLVWEYRAAAGIWNSPACDGRMVYVGDRGGTFHAVDATTGEAAWTFQTGAMILKPASFSTDNRRIVFGSEDMHVYCLLPDGKLLWKSPKLPGLSLRDGAPTIWDGKVVVRTNPAKDFHGALKEGGKAACDIQRAIPLDDNEDGVVTNTINMYFLRHTPRREKAEYEGLLAYLREHPQSRTWFTFDLEDGSEPWIVPVMYTGGLHNPPTPPTFDPESMRLYTIVPTALSVYCSGVSQVGIGIGCVDPETGRLTNVTHAYPDREPGYFAGMPMIADETSALSLMGGFLTVTHMGAVGGVELESRKIRQLAGTRDTYGGLFGPGAHGGWNGSRRLAEDGYVQNTINEWHGPDRSIVSIAAGRMFWVVGGQVVCLGGPDVPATDSGGEKAPEPIPWKAAPWVRINGGNLVRALDIYDQSVQKKRLDVAAAKACVAEPPESALPDDALAVDIRKRLDAAIAELIEGSKWAPFVVELGISHEELHFARTSLSMQTVAMALPYLSPEVREKAVAYLDGLFNQGVPLRKPVFDMHGRRREYHDLPPELLEGRAARAVNRSAAIDDLYALWAYAHYADRWERVIPQAGAILEAFRSHFTDPPQFDAEAENRTSVAKLNAEIAGVIAYARIAAKAGRTNERKMAEYRLGQLVTERVHFEIADERLLSARSHHGRVPRYENLTPEIVRMLADHAGEQLTANLDTLRQKLPVWYQAWGERMIGGENYVSPPALSRGIFLASAHAGAAKPAQLTSVLDQPWCRADLYYMEKLTALLRAAAAVPTPEAPTPPSADPAG